MTHLFAGAGTSRASYAISVRKLRVLCLSFRCACPEPVWVNRSVFSISTQERNAISAGGHSSLHLSDKELRAAVEAFDANKNGDIKFSGKENATPLLVRDSIVKSSFYEDRPGTNIGKVERQGGAFSCRVSPGHRTAEGPFQAHCKGCSY